MTGDVPWGGHGRYRAVVAPKSLSGAFPCQAKRAGRAGMLKLGRQWLGQEDASRAFFSSKKEKAALSMEN